MTRTTLVSGFSALICLAGSAQAVNYFDGVFNNSNWTLTTITNTNGIGSSAAGFQVTSGGNPLEYRRIRHNLVVGGPNGAVHSIHMNNTAFYDPFTQGAISSINYSEDSINFIPDTIVPGNGQGSGLVIAQSGRIYEMRNPVFVMPYSGFSNWTTNSATGLVAADFWELDAFGTLFPGNNPDFSASGGIMQLGFWRGNSGNGSYNTDCGIDNWHVEIVPAPSTLALVGIGGLIAARRRR